MRLGTPPLRESECQADHRWHPHRKPVGRSAVKGLPLRDKSEGRSIGTKHFHRPLVTSDLAPKIRIERSWSRQCRSAQRETCPAKRVDFKILGLKFFASKLF